MKHSDLCFDPIQLNDLPELMRIEKSAYPHPWSSLNMESCLQNKDLAIKMTHHQHLVGYAFVSIILDDAHLLNLTIDPYFQRQGLGRILLTHLIEMVQTRQVLEMFLEVRASNLGARYLYEKLGFNELSIRKNYYPLSTFEREDAIIMAKTTGSLFC